MSARVSSAGLERETLILSAAEVRRLLGLAECIDAVESAFRAEDSGSNGPRGVMGLAFPGGGFHVKAAGLAAAGGAVGGALFAAKVNANFPGNRERTGRPAIQGVIALFDASDGAPLALLDSIEITALRTAAATAVAAKKLARPESSVAAIVGCGAQGRFQLRALAVVLPIGRAVAFDRDPESARRFADEMSRELGIPVETAESAAGAARAGDVCVTCTPSREPFLGRSNVRPGTFIAAVGADDRGKQELESDLVASARVVADVIEQCVAMGELRHPIEAGLMMRDQIHADLAQIVSGARPGRTSPDQITIFDSTGTALEDVAAAAVVYRKALAEGAGLRLIFGD